MRNNSRGQNNKENKKKNLNDYNNRDNLKKNNRDQSTKEESKRKKSTKDMLPQKKRNKDKFYYENIKKKRSIKDNYFYNKKFMLMIFIIIMKTNHRNKLSMKLLNAAEKTLPIRATIQYNNNLIRKST